MTPIVLLVVLSRFLGAVDPVRCGGHDAPMWCGGHGGFGGCGGHAPTCSQCGSSPLMCNGDCEWSYEQQTCQKMCCSNPIGTDGKDKITLPVVIGFDQYFSKQHGGNKGAAHSPIFWLIWVVKY